MSATDDTPALHTQRPASSWHTKLFRMMTNHPEVFCLITAFVFSICNKLGQSGITIRPPVQRAAPLPVPFFPGGVSATHVRDFPLGELDEVGEILSREGAVVVMFYAPWCAQSRRTRVEFMAAAKYLSSQVKFVSINCWYPAGLCRKTNKFLSFPVIYFYHRNLDGYRYSGPLGADYMIAFVENLMYPLTHITSHDSFSVFLAKHERAMVAYYDLTTSPSPPGYMQYFYAAMRAIEKDPHNRIGFGIATSDKVGRLLLNLSPGQMKFVQYLNSTLVYPPTENVTSSAIIKWLVSNVQKASTTVLLPTGSKSMQLASLVSGKPTLILFLPYYPLAGLLQPHLMLREIATAYYGCGNVSDWRLTETLRGLDNAQASATIDRLQLTGRCAEIRRRERENACDNDKNDRTSGKDSDTNNSDDKPHNCRNNEANARNTTHVIPGLRNCCISVQVGVGRTKAADCDLCLTLGSRHVAYDSASCPVISTQDVRYQWGLQQKLDSLESTSKVLSSSSSSSLERVGEEWGKEGADREKVGADREEEGADREKEGEGWENEGADREKRQWKDTNEKEWKKVEGRWKETQEKASSTTEHQQNFRNNELPQSTTTPPTPGSFMPLSPPQCHAIRPTYHPGERLSLCCPPCPRPIHSQGRRRTDTYHGEAAQRECQQASIRTAHGWMPGLLPEDEGNVTIQGLSCSAGNRSLDFVVMDSRRAGMFMERLGIPQSSASTRAAVIVDMQAEEQYVLEGPVTKQSIVSMISNYTAGSLGTFRRSQPLPPPPVECVTPPCIIDVTAQTFQQVVMDEEKDVVLLYHAPWCGFCSGFAHIYLSLARYFRHSPQIVFARINGELNDLPWEYTVDSYPTIILFPAHRKSESAVFPSTWKVRVPVLVQWVLTHAAAPDSKLDTALAACTLPCLRANAAAAAAAIRDLQRTRAEVEIKLWRVGRMEKVEGGREKMVANSDNSAASSSSPLSSSESSSAASSAMFGAPHLSVRYQELLGAEVRRLEVAESSARQLHAVLLRAIETGGGKEGAGPWLEKHTLVAIQRRHGRT